MLAVVAFVCMHKAKTAKNIQTLLTNNVLTCCVRLQGKVKIRKVQDSFKSIKMVDDFLNPAIKKAHC